MKEEREGQVFENIAQRSRHIRNERIEPLEIGQNNGEICELMV
jgi:hypothetical protein